MNFLKTLLPNGENHPQTLLILWVLSVIAILNILPLDTVTFFVILMTGFLMKHQLSDFNFQNYEMAVSKGIFMDSLGVQHSMIHGFMTMMVVFVSIGITHQVAGGAFGIDVVSSAYIALIVGIVDTVLHYIIDYAKVNISRGLSITQSEYWVNLGFDQFLHNLFYVCASYYVTMSVMYVM